MKLISRNLNETKDIARELVCQLAQKDKATVIALVGDLGAGKTAFSQAVGEALGVRDAIQSPTFLIEKIYELHKARWKYLVHIDAYRLEDESELVSLGWHTITARPENLVIVEWADKVKNILPEDAIHIVLTHGQVEDEREIEIGIA